MKNIPLISRHITPLCNSFTEALELLETHEIEDGELVYVEYKETEETRNIILALGIGNHEYRILNLGASEPINGVLSYFPTIDTLIHNQKYITLDSGNYYLVYSKDGKTRTIEEIPSNLKKSFININTGEYYFSWDGIIKPLTDIPTEDEAREKVETKLRFEKRNWLENSKTSPSYISNKPKLSDLGDLTYTIEKSEDDNNLYYSLYWTPYGTEEYILEGTIVAPKNNMPVSGELKRVGENDSIDWEIGDYYIDLTLTDNSHIYIKMQDLIINYEAGNGIEINEDRRINIKLDITSGLTITPGGKLKWDLVTYDNNGAMSALDHSRVENLNIEDYVKISDLEGGAVNAKVSENASYLLPTNNSYTSISDSNFIIRNTGGSTFLDIPGFNIAKIDYISGTINGIFKPNYFRSTSNNIFNYQDIDKQLLGKAIIDGEIRYIDESTVIFWVYLPLAGEYAIHAPGLDLGNTYLSEEPGSIINGILINLSQGYDEDNYSIFTISSPGWFISTYYNYDSSLSEICLSYLHDSQQVPYSGFLDSEYKESIIELKLPESNTWGAVSKSIGVKKIEDCWRDVGGELQFQQEWGRARLEDLNWIIEGSNTYVTMDLSDLISPNTTGWLIYDNTNLISAEVLETKLIVTANEYPAGYLFYILHDRIDYNTGVSSYYNFGSLGFEEFIGVDQPANTVLIDYYLNNDQFLIEDWAFKSNQDFVYRKTDLISDLNNLSGIDIEKPVQGNAIIKYLEESISNNQLNTAKDLSMYNIFGVPQASMNTANCYVIKDPGYYKFPLVYGNGIKNGQPNFPAFRGKSGDHVLNYFINFEGFPIKQPWIESDNLYEYNIYSYQLDGSSTEGFIKDIILTEDRYIKFYYRGNQGFEENFIIGIKNEVGNTIWSWHIWSVRDLDRLLPVTINNYISTTNREEGTTIFQMMPINLGANLDTPEQSAVYQWGRKDPIIWEVGSGYGVYGTMDDHNQGKTIQNSIQLPKLAFTEYAEMGHWFYLDSNNPGHLPYNLWDASATASDSQQETSIKSIYDPCPPGFKVPVMAAFHGFIDSAESYILTENNGNLLRNYEYGFRFKRSLSDTTGIFFPYLQSYSGDCTISQNSPAEYFSSSVNTYNVNRDLCNSFFIHPNYQSFEGGNTFGGLIRPILDK